ncbi:glyoxylate/hydroxypyruvate reductase A [Pseudomonas sp. LTJR-52]|uniref:2-hydroxyacid dehydrogenase n=1 Tax=Pseudomonas sp. LTJR-52 TaxID=2479392 RepID=UPI000EFA65A6|nr:glyoxylate/hydroxypyruvate reductase A [Pseudomonas sp. LTJR-52]AYN96784.1 glyoxylate/hydroxypyruvate reductase A [Pseudomonas sp. LTJR-52]
MALLCKFDDVRSREWTQLFAQHAPDIDVRIWPDLGDPAEIRYLAAWQPPENLMTYFPNLEVLFATSAGVDQFDLAAIPETLPLVRMLDPEITRGIVEYATMAVLSLHRHLPRYQQQQQRQCWKAHRLIPACQRRVGVMGLGQLGQAVLGHLQQYGFLLSGWSRSAHQVPGVTCYAGQDELQAFLGQSDILICLLPLTEQTQGILCRETFAALPSGASLINIGRGKHLIEDDLLQALDSNHLEAAFIDVLEDEPASAEHPFWHHPGITLTPHIAAMTSALGGFEALLANIRRFEANEPMQGVVDRSTGY